MNMAEQELTLNERKIVRWLEKNDSRLAALEDAVPSIGVMCDLHAQIAELTLRTDNICSSLENHESCILNLDARLAVLESRGEAATSGENQYDLATYRVWQKRAEAAENSAKGWQSRALMAEGKLADKVELATALVFLCSEDTQVYHMSGIDGHQLVVTKDDGREIYVGLDANKRPAGRDAAKVEALVTAARAVIDWYRKRNHVLPKPEEALDDALSALDADAKAVAPSGAKDNGQ
jgi:hypothetical protein